MTDLRRGEVTRAAIKGFIRTHWQRYGYAPTLSEIALGVGLASHNAVRSHLLALQASGEVTSIPGKYRTLRVPAPPRKKIRHEIFMYIAAYQRQFEVAPTQMEIAQGVGVSAATVRTHLVSLRDSGCLHWDSGKARSIRIA